jgi:hypothetical protein
VGKSLSRSVKKRPIGKRLEIKPKRAEARSTPVVPSLKTDDIRLLTTLATSSAIGQFLPHELKRLDRLVQAGYLVRDPAMTTPRFRLTARGWAFARQSKGK